MAFYKDLSKVKFTAWFIAVIMIARWGAIFVSTLFNNKNGFMDTLSDLIVIVIYVGLIILETRVKDKTRMKTMGLEISIQTKLTLIKTVHTAIWAFFNVVIFYMLYASIARKLDIWLWMGYGFVFLEGLILFAFKSHCPLNLLARKYTNSTKDNFDIYLPSWLAKYTKRIYTTIFAIIIIITLYQTLH